MSAATYVPQPGTIPARALAFLATLPPGGEVQTGVLVDALEQPSSSIITSCQMAVDFGLIGREKREGRLFWRYGSKAPSIPLHERQPYIAPEPRERKTPAPRELRQAPASLPHVDPDAAFEAAPKVDAPREDAEAAHASAAPSGREEATPNDGLDPQGMTATAARCVEVLKPTPFRVALWSDGQLELRRGARVVETLSREETKALVDYLDRVLTEEGA